MQFICNLGFTEEFIHHTKLSYAKSIEINESFWRNRLLFPIYQEHNLVGYEGRSYTGDPKKVLYHKGCRVGSIYNLDNINPEEMVYVTEGIKGLSRVWINLSKNVVSTFGAALTSVQKATLANFPKLCFIIDNDKAGHKMIKDFDDSAKREFYVAIPEKEGADPWDCSKEELIYITDKKVKYIDYLLDNSALFEKETIQWNFF